MLQHIIRLPTRKTIYLICHFLHAYFTFYRLARCILSCQTFFLFSLENDDMASSKRCVKLFSLVFILNSNSSAYNSHKDFFADESLCHAEQNGMIEIYVWVDKKKGWGGGGGYRHFDYRAKNNTKNNILQFLTTVHTGHSCTKGPISIRGNLPPPPPPSKRP